MSQFNLKFIFALLLVCLGVSEILVFNEEVFIFVCFFIFFNLISVFAGGSINQVFSDIESDLEKNFLQASKSAKNAIVDLALGKKQALNSIVRVLIFFKAFRNIAVQKGLLSATESFVQNARACTFALNTFKLRVSKDESFPSPVAQVFTVNARRTLGILHFKNVPALSVFKSFLISPKSKSRSIDCLLNAGLLSVTKSTLI